MMWQHPAAKYRPTKPVALPDRQWPNRQLSAPPIWMSTDLRDGNQALFEPMAAAVKHELFKWLVRIGFKEIEIGFPSASQTEFDFIRELIGRGGIPEDVTIEVLTPARAPLIHRTLEALRGAPRAIVHLYNATSPVFRRVVFQRDAAAVIRMATDAALLIQQLAAAQPDTLWRFQYSPETFSQTELPFALEICDAVTQIWNACPERPVIINLPATVEASTPNIFADQVEWMHRHLARRDGIILSVHPHNDRGSAVAAAELALMAGADRVEGCLFGNGERTGNVDLVTLALNLYSQGIDPGLDFSDLNAIARVAERCTGLPVPARHPYAGDLVFTAFSGSHQDAIHKGLAAQIPGTFWEVPYLPIDPADVGRQYDSIIRVNSQSGKGGAAYLLERHYGLVLPRRLQIEFGALVKTLAEQTGEVLAADLWALLEREYLHARSPLAYLGHSLADNGAHPVLQLHAHLHGEPVTFTGHGNGPIDALLAALALPVQLLSYEERALGGGSSARAAAFVELEREGGAPRFGIGIHENIVAASLHAVLSAVNRLHQQHPLVPLPVPGLHRPGADAGPGRRA
ncbi:MAG TPA: 2-isopropylmalate synthase [Acidiferrobacteraceae bacterium]|nr:2-isopropylmalate synthase [Acidiferrobacteraceae bacterium]